MDFKFEQIKELLKAAEESPSVTEIEITAGETRIRISKNAPITHFAGGGGAASITSVLADPPALAPVLAPEAPAPRAEPEKPVKAGNYIKSPLVGTFYESLESGGKPLAPVGRKIKRNDVVCIVEAMKVMNEIRSEFDGEIAEVMLKNGQMAEFGQPLFRVV